MNRHVHVFSGFLLSHVDFFHDSFSITPANVFPPHLRVWTLLTYFLVERNILTLLWTIVSVHLACTVVEPLWGRVQLIQFFVLINICVALSITFGCFLLYGLTSHLPIFFDVKFGGLAGFNGAVLVSIKQVG